MNDEIDYIINQEESYNLQYQPLPQQSFFNYQPIQLNGNVTLLKSSLMQLPNTIKLHAPKTTVPWLQRELRKTYWRTQIYLPTSTNSGFISFSSWFVLYELKKDFKRNCSNMRLNILQGEILNMFEQFLLKYFFNSFMIQIKMKRNKTISWSYWQMYLCSSTLHAFLSLRCRHDAVGEPWCLEFGGLLDNWVTQHEWLFSWIAWVDNQRSFVEAMICTVSFVFLGWWYRLIFDVALHHSMHFSTHFLQAYSFFLFSLQIRSKSGSHKRNSLPFLLLLEAPYWTTFCMHVLNIDNLL